MSLRRRIVRAIDSPTFWVVVAYFVLIVVGIRVEQINRRTVREQATRNAETQTQYETCVGSIPVLRRVNRFVVGVEYVHETIYENALAMHAITAPGTRVYATQARNLLRLKEAVDSAAGVHFPVPTIASCEAQRIRRIHGEALGQPIRALASGR